MAEKVVIDIELKGFGNAQKGLEELTKAQIAQQEIIKQTKQEIKDYEKSIKELEEAQKDGKDLTETEIQLLDLYNQNLQTARESLAGQKDELSSVNSERRAAVKEVENYNTVLDAELGSNEQLRAQLKILTQEYDALSQEERENSEVGEEKTQQIKELTDKLKENESAIGDNRRNVGNYSASIKEALGNVTIMGTNLGGLVAGFEETAKSTKAAAAGLIFTTGVQEAQTKATQAQTATQLLMNKAVVASRIAFNIFKLAMISTGILAFVVAVGSVVAFFMSTERGAMKLKVAMAVLGSVVDNVKDIFIGIGENIVNAFKNPQQAIKDLGQAIIDNVIQRGKSALNLFKSLASFDFKAAAEDLAGVFTGIDVSIDKATTAAKRFAVQLKNDAKEAADAQKKENDLVFRRRELLLNNAKLEGEIAILRVKAADKENLTQEEIIKTLEKAIEVKNKILENNIEIAAEELKIAEQRASIAENDVATEEDLFEKKLALEKAKSARESETLRLQKQLASEKFTLQTETIAAELKILKLQGEESLELEKEIAEKKKDFLLSATNLGESERKAIILQYEKEVSDLRIDFLQQAIDDQKESLDTKFLDLELAYLKELALLGGNEDAKKALTERYQKERLESQREAIEAQIQIIQSELMQLTASSSGGLNEAILSDEDSEKLNKKLLQLQIELQKTNQAFNDVGEGGENGEPDIFDAKLEKMRAFASEVANIANFIGSLVSGIAATIANKTQSEINTLQDQLNRGLISQEDFEQKKSEIEIKSAKKQQKIQITQAIIAGVAAAASALGNTTLPFPISLTAIPVIAAATATQVKAIKSQKFADGGLIQGKSHSQGGVPFSVSGSGGFEAEGGEFIHKTKAVDYYGVPFMQALNNLQIPKMFKEGGLVAPLPNGSISSQVSSGVSEFISATQNKTIEVINIEQNFSKLQTKVNNVEQARTY